MLLTPVFPLLLSTLYTAHVAHTGLTQTPLMRGTLIETDRYSLIAPQASIAETDPLAVNVEVVFPPAVKTVKDAVRYLLTHSGWVLAANNANSDAFALTLKRPLPQVHRQLSLMSLRQALQTLVGRHFVPVEDPLRRIYSFDLKDEYKGLLSHDQ